MTKGNNHQQVKLQREKIGGGKNEKEIESYKLVYACLLTVEKTFDIVLDGEKMFKVNYNNRPSVFESMC